jgi:hypothetical protein
MKNKQVWASLILILIGAVLRWWVPYSGNEPWDDEMYFVYLGLAGLGAGLGGVKPWGAGLFLVAAPFGASIWRVITQGWSKFGPLEQFWFIVLAGFIAVSAFIGNLIPSAKLRAAFKKALFGSMLFLAFTATASAQTYYYSTGFTVAWPIERAHPHRLPALRRWPRKPEPPRILPCDRSRWDSICESRA